MRQALLLPVVACAGIALIGYGLIWVGVTSVGYGLHQVGKLMTYASAWP